MRRVACVEESITTKLTANRGGATAQHPSYFALTEFLILPDLNRGAFFNAEFGIKHGNTLPEGTVLHSVIAAAQDRGQYVMIVRCFLDWRVSRSR